MRAIVVLHGWKGLTWPGHVRAEILWQDPCCSSRMRKHLLNQIATCLSRMSCSCSCWVIRHDPPCWVLSDMCNGRVSVGAHFGRGPMHPRSASP